MLMDLVAVIGKHWLGSNLTIDSTTISDMGFVDSMTVFNMINSGGSELTFNFRRKVWRHNKYPIKKSIYWWNSSNELCSP